jgi:hypothetical protein
VHRWVERAFEQVQLADQQPVQDIETEVIEMDELHSFAGTKQLAPETADQQEGKH